jgi:iron complex outermembrane receptor protein
LLLTGEYTKLGGVGPIAYGQPYVYTASGAISHQDVNIASRDHWSLNTAGSISTTTKTVRGEASYDLDFMTVSYFGGYRKMMYARSNDIDGTAMTTNAGYLTYPQNENEGTQNHELRFTSQGNSRLTWQAGLYYFRERNTLYSIYGYDNVVPFVPTYIFSYKVGANSKAAFAQLGYKIAPGLKLEVGYATARTKVPHWLPVR